MSYTALVLWKESRDLLLDIIPRIAGTPKEWEEIAHHMTIQFGSPKLPEELEHTKEKNYELIATHFGYTDKVLAVRVEGFPSKNDVPHVTVAVNRKEGGKPFMSNQIENWEELEEPLSLYGKVKEEL